MIDNENYDYYNPSSGKWINKDNWWKWGIAILVFIGAPIYLALKPADFTPIVQVLFSLFLFLLAFWLGFTKEIERATRQASDKWLPQAESVIYRLLTLHNNVKRFASTAKNTTNAIRKHRLAF